jgi:osmotically inducible lipoprotein OsmB
MSPYSINNAGNLIALQKVYLKLTITLKENTMRKIQITTMALVTLLLLTACGSSTGDRALSGGGIGAGVGTGAIIGGAVGAAAGGLTKQKDVDLGKPIWR